MVGIHRKPWDTLTDSEKIDRLQEDIRHLSAELLDQARADAMLRGMLKSLSDEVERLKERLDGPAS
jgi:hypothetical protein